MSADTAHAPIPAPDRVPLSQRVGRAIRSIRVGRRIFLIVALNALVMAVMAGLVVGGARVVDHQREEVRRARDTDRLLVEINGDIARLQSLIHRYLHTPTGALLGEISQGQGALLRKLDGPARADETIAADVARLTVAIRRFLGSFEALRDIIGRIRRTYETAILNAGTDMPTLYTALDVAMRERNPDSLERLYKARESFADSLIAANAFYLSADRSAADRAERNLDLIAASIPGLAGGAADEPLGRVLDELGRRVEALRQAMAMLRHSADRQAKLVRDEIDGGQRAMAQIIDGLIAGVNAREREAQRGYERVIRVTGTLLVATALLFIALSAAASWVIGQSIRRPLRTLNEAMAAIAGGDYDRRVAGTEVQDEIGAMARSLEVFKANAIVKQRIEREREVLEGRWRTMLETAPAGISILSVEGLERLYTNPKYLELFHLRPDDAATDLPIAATFMEPGGLERVIEAVADDGHLNGLEVERKRPDGTAWWCMLDVRPIEFDGRPAAIVWHYDVTARRKAEQELRSAKERAEAALADLHEAQASLIQSEKMAALGSLVAGVAHEINTPVGLTVTAASLLADESGAIVQAMAKGAIKRSEFERYLGLANEASQRILSNANRAAELIQSFKQVAVDQTLDDRRVFDLGRYINEVLTSLRPRLKPVGHTVAVECPPGLAIDGYPGPLAQVLTNLVMNSVIHAYGPGVAGHIALTVREGDGGEVVLVYADDGRGIPAEVLPRIFDPFFTTNRSGGGTGLGLNIVFNIVQTKLRGRIGVVSTVGRGTTFTLRFPKRMVDA